MESSRASASSAKAPARVCLYCCIPAHEENRDRQLSPSQQWRRSLRRAVDDVTLRTTGRLVGRFFDYETVSGSNIGDIAIRTQIRAMIDEACGTLPVNWMEVGWGALDDRIVAEINETCDLLIIGGGAYFHLGRTGQDTTTATRFLADLTFLNRVQVPIVCLAVGASAVFTPTSVAQPKLDPLTFAQVQAFFEKCAAVSVRDHTSAGILPTVAGRLATVVPDPALYIESVAAGGGAGRPRIGLNLPFSGHFTQRLLQEYLRPVAETLRAAALRHDAKIVYFSHVSSERIVPHWLRLMGLEVEEVDADPAVIIEHYRGLTMHVGSMMHSCIFALANDVPTVALAYDIKLSALFELMNLQDRVVRLPEYSAETLNALIDDTMARRDTLSRAIADRRRELRPDLDREVREIAQLIERATLVRPAADRPHAAVAR